MAQPPPPFFDRLPREIRDEIYRLAFVDESKQVVKIIAVSKLIDREREKRRDGEQAPSSTQSIPTCPLQAMMVNWQFFDEAASIWFSNNLLQLPERFSDIIQASSVAKAYLTNLICSWGGVFGWMTFCGFKDLQNLRFLRLMVHDHLFDEIKTRLCYRHSLGDVDFKSLNGLGYITGLKTVRRVEVVALDTTLNLSSQELAKYQENIASLERFLNAQVKGTGQSGRTHQTSEKIDWTRRLRSQLSTSSRVTEALTSSRDDTNKHCEGCCQCLSIPNSHPNQSTNGLSSTYDDEWKTISERSEGASTADDEEYEVATAQCSDLANVDDQLDTTTHEEGSALSTAGSEAHGVINEQSTGLSTAVDMISNSLADMELQFEDVVNRLSEITQRISAIEDHLDL